MQRIANPWTSVRLREAPPFSLSILCLQEEISKKNEHAILAQLVERNLAKVEVIGSNPMYRSKFYYVDFFRHEDGVLLFSNRHRNKVLRALVVELVDTRDLKSLDVRVVPVQVRPGAPSIGLLPY